jgi:HAE1 family hydrophobic/amphiphilic exporter-1
MIRFFVERRVATTMTFAALLLLGLVAAPRLKVSLFPDIVYPRLAILTPYGSVPPEEMETLVSVPVEDAAGAVSGVKKITSRSEEGLSIVEVSFDWGTNLDLATIQVRQKVDLARSVLPQDCGRSIIVKHDPSSRSIITLVARPSGIAFRDTRDYVEKNVRPLLERVDAVAGVSIRGGYRREIQVNIDLGRMKARGLTLAQLRDSVSASNFNFPAGNVRKDDKELAVRVVGELTDTASIERVVVGRSQSGSPVFLSDVASIEDASRERTGSAFYNGEPAVLIGIKKEPGKNTIETAAAIRETLAELNRRFEKSVTFTLVQDNSLYISDAIDGVRDSALLGALISFLVVYAFLKNLRSALIINTSVPLAVIASFGAMYAQGISINVMSLGGLAMGVGMVVDNSIVVLEAIEQVREQHPEKSLIESSIEGTRLVAASVLASTFTSITVFLPVVFVSGIAGAVFRDLALAVTYSLISSLLCAFALVPMLAAIPAGQRMEKAERALSRIFSPVFSLSNSILAFLKQTLLALLARALQSPKPVLTACFLFSLGGLLLFLPLEKSLFPQVDQGNVNAEIEMPAGTTLGQSEELQLRFHKYLLSNSLSNHALSFVGRDEDDLSSAIAGLKKPAYSSHELDIKGRLDSPSFLAQTSTALSQAGNVKQTLRMKGDVMEEMLGASSGGILIQVESDTRHDARTAALSLKASIEKLPGVRATSTAQADDPEVRLILDRTKAASLGLTAEEVGSLVRLAFAGEIATNIHEGDREIPVRLRLRTQDRSSAESVRALPIAVNDSTVDLSSLLTVRESSAVSSVLRENQRRIEQVRVEGANDDQARQIESMVQSASSPSARIAIQKENEETMASLRNLGFAFLLSIVLIYQLLAAQFESFIHPLSLALSIPLMFSGVSLALFLTGHGLNITSAMGMIMLVGIVCNASVILYEYIEQNRNLMGHEIEKLPEILRLSVEHRIRPILLTTLTTILGLLPLAWPAGSGGDVQAPLAVAVMGGLTVSTVLTMVVFPVVFYVIESRRRT